MTLESDLVKRIVALERRLAEMEAVERSWFGVRIRVQRSTAQTITNNAWTAQIFDTIAYENKPPGASSQWSSGYPTRLTCVVAGYYLVATHVMFAANSTGDRIIGLYKNGAIFANTSTRAGASLGVSIQLIELVTLNVGDYIESWVFQNCGGNLNTDQTNYLYLEWVLLG
jgi:hypothetical protein